MLWCFKLEFSGSWGLFCYDLVFFCLGLCLSLFCMFNWRRIFVGIWIGIVMDFGVILLIWGFYLIIVYCGVVVSVGDIFLGFCF